MANPRKFSEKIALQNQKQAEETAAFEKIMREVSEATSKVNRNSPNLSPNLSPTTIVGLGAFKGGSLPNVSAPINKKPIDKTQSDEMAMLQMKLGPIPNLPLNDGSNYKDNGGGQSPHPNPPSSPNLRESRGRSVGVGPMRRPADRKIDTSPYNSGNTAYLSPPSDTSWRRVSSDSAIHQSLVQDDGHHNHHHNHHASHSPLTRSPTSHRRMTNSHSPSNTTSNKNFSNEQRNHNSIGTPDGRPRSSCGLPRLPGIHIYPSPHENSIQQIPIGNNTGSLPDLTSVHFPSPLHTPIDQEYDHSNSPFSSSPVTASPLTLSPTIPARYPNNTKFNYSPTHSPGDNSNAYSPTHSQHGGQLLQPRNFLSVPDGTSFRHGLKNLSSPLDNSYQQQQQQQQTSQTGSPSSPHSFINTTHSNQHNQTGYQQQNRHHSPPIHSHGSQGNLNNLQQPSLSGYRSPQCRPSPGSSPGLLLQNNGDSNPSAPCSPAPSSLGNNGQNYDYSNGYSLGTLPIQQNFEHFSLDWATLLQSLVESGCTWTAQVQVDNPSDFIPHSQNAQPFTDFDNATFTHLNINLGDLGSQNNIGGAGNLNMSNSNLNMSSSNMNMSNSNLCNNTNNSVHGNMNSQQQHQQQQQSHNTSSSPQPSQQQVQQSQQSPSQHRQTPQNLQQQLTNSQTPNTPTSIPEIIFTDFSSSSSEYTKDLFADGKFDLGDLGPMDCVAYQMLSDPNYTIADSRTEDSFREDLDET